jgi:molecular chaperone HscB
MNHFKLFDLPAEYLINELSLQKNYLAMQSKSHPDRARDEGDRKDKLEQSMLINEAFKILKDDYLRAVYLLELNDQIFDDANLKNTLTTEELADILDQYELVDNEENIDLLREIEKTKNQERQQLVTAVGAAFAKNNLQQALDLTVRLKYLTNLINNIRLKIRSV